jgi:hypothetical protein
MFIGFLKAVESVMPPPMVGNKADETMFEAILSSLNTRIVETCFPNGGHDIKKLYAIQGEMHKLNIPDRITSMMEEMHDKMPKTKTGKLDMHDRERVMDAFFPRADADEVGGQ